MPQNKYPKWIVWKITKGLKAYWCGGKLKLKSNKNGAMLQGEFVPHLMRNALRSLNQGNLMNITSRTIRDRYPLLYYAGIYEIDRRLDLYSDNIE